MSSVAGNINISDKYQQKPSGLIEKLYLKLNYTSSRSGYLYFVILFGILFTILQILDIITTIFALENEYVKEANPLFGHEWFIPLKFTMIFLIMFIMSRIPDQNQTLAKNTMIGIIYMYVVINVNNLYYIFLF